MGFKYSWLEPKRVVLVEVEGKIGIPELRGMAAELNSYLESGEHPVYVITDARGMTEFPKSLAEVRGALSTMGEFGADIFVGFENPIAKFLARVISQLSKFEVQMVSTMDEAVDILRRLDSSLDVKAP